MTYEEAKTEILTTSVMVLESIRKKRKFEKAIRKAIEALEKQIPKKPLGMTSSKYGTKHKCPNCGVTFRHIDKDDVQWGHIPKYCGECGQAIGVSKNDR